MGESRTLAFDVCERASCTAKEFVYNKSKEDAPLHQLHLDRRRRPAGLLGEGRAHRRLLHHAVLAPRALCLLGVGVAPGAIAPASATLVILSNDPASPETDVPLTLLSAPTPTP
jgi:hypothetical protein